MAKSPREAAFRKKVWEFLRELPNSHFTAVQQVAIRGSPDYFGCINGRFCAPEIKRDQTAKRSALQNYNVGKFRSAGGWSEFVYPENWESIKAELIKMATGQTHQL
jgi:hypothetical protein